MFHKITSATPLPDLKLFLRFENGVTKEYDMRLAIAKAPVLRALENEALFKNVSVDPGGYGVSWTDDLDIDGEELWVNGTDVSTPFDNLISFAEATAMWHLSESALRKAIAYGKLKQGIDAQKFGKQWIVRMDSMEREYGPLKA